VCSFSDWVSGTPGEILISLPPAVSRPNFFFFPSLLLPRFYVFLSSFCPSHDGRCASRPPRPASPLEISPPPPPQPFSLSNNDILPKKFFPFYLSMNQHPKQAFCSPPLSVSSPPAYPTVRVHEVPPSSPPEKKQDLRCPLLQILLLGD